AFVLSDCLTIVSVCLPVPPRKVWVEVAVQRCGKTVWLSPSEISRVIEGSPMLNRLNAVKVRAIKKPDRYADGGGLYRQVTKGTDEQPSKSWLFRFKYVHK